jgi:hypothetical protein
MVSVEALSSMVQLTGGLDLGVQNATVFSVSSSSSSIQMYSDA